MKKNIYYYIYYKIYKFSENAPSVWWSEWKSTATLDILLIFLIQSLCIYSRIFISPLLDIMSNKVEVIFITVVICLCNYFIFNYNDRWKKIINEFDQLPKKKNRIGTFIVFIIIIIIINLFYSYYLMSKTI